MTAHAGSIVIPSIQEPIGAYGYISDNKCKFVVDSKYRNYERKTITYHKKTYIFDHSDNKFLETSNYIETDPKQTIILYENLHNDIQLTYTREYAFPIVCSFYSDHTNDNSFVDIERFYNNTLSTYKLEKILIHTNEVFGSIKWCTERKKLIFIVDIVKKLDDVLDLSRFDYVENFGNDLENVKNPFIYSLDPIHGYFNKLPIDFKKNHYPKKIFTNKTDTYILVLCMDKFKSGIVYCDNQQTILCHLDSKNIIREINTRKCVLDVCFPCDKNYNHFMFYLCRKPFGSHRLSSTLIIHNLISGQDIASYDNIYANTLPEFASIEQKDGQTIASVLINSSTFIENKIELAKYSLVIGENTITKKLLLLNNNLSVSTLCCVPFTISNNIKLMTLLSFSSLNTPPFISLYYDNECISPNKLPYMNCSQVDSSYFHTMYFDSQYNVADSLSDTWFNYCFVKNKRKAPLVVIAHGGPHSQFVNQYDFFYSSLKMFNLLFVNYVGSTGFNDQSLESLHCRVGSLEINNIIFSLDDVKKRFADHIENEIFFLGGSYGGFIGAHLCAHFPSLFNRCVLRNPVIDWYSSIITSDIPEYPFVMLGGQKKFKNMYIDSNLLHKMIELSPIRYAHHVKTPTLLLLGKRDLRVNKSQGLMYAKILKSSGCYVHVKMYPVSSHSISGVDEEINSLLSTIQFFLSYNILNS